MESRLVGRQAETAVLQQQIEALGQGQGGVTAVIGDAGVGKSRLVHDLRRGGSCTRPDAQMVDVRCLSYAETVSYSAMQEVVRRLCDIGPESDEQQAKILINSHLNKSGQCLKPSSKPLICLTF